MPVYSGDDRDDDTQTNRGESHRDHSIARIEQRLRQRDGKLSISNAATKMEAEDIGDVDERPNPRARDLGYPEACGGVNHDEDTFAGLRSHEDNPSGLQFFFDAPVIMEAGERYIAIEDETFIEDVRLFA